MQFILHFAFLRSGANQSKGRLIVLLGDEPTKYPLAGLRHRTPLADFRSPNENFWCRHIIERRQKFLFVVYSSAEDLGDKVRSICRHCLQILTSETIKSLKFRTIHILILVCFAVGRGKATVGGAPNPCLTPPMYLVSSTAFGAFFGQLRCQEFSFAGEAILIPDQYVLRWG